MDSIYIFYNNICLNVVLSLRYHPSYHQIISVLASVPTYFFRISNAFMEMKSVVVFIYITKSSINMLLHYFDYRNEPRQEDLTTTTNRTPRRSRSQTTRRRTQRSPEPNLQDRYLRFTRKTRRREPRSRTENLTTKLRSEQQRSLDAGPGEPIEHARLAGGRSHESQWRHQVGRSDIGRGTASDVARQGCGDTAEGWGVFEAEGDLGRDADGVPGHARIEQQVPRYNPPAQPHAGMRYRKR